MAESLKRMKSLSLPKGYPENIDLIRLITYKTFMKCITNDVRCTIMSLIARGHTTALDISSALGSSRTAVYRHLHNLHRNGFIVYMNGKFYVAARFFLVYDIEPDSEGHLRMKIYADKGGFVDEEVGFVLIKGEICQCDVCNVIDRCLKAVKSLARKLDVKIRSEKPLEAFIEIAREIVYRDVLNIMKNGYLIVKTSLYGEEYGEEGVNNEETSIQT